MIQRKKTNQTTSIIVAISRRLTQDSVPTPTQMSNQGPTYGSVFLTMINMAADDRMPTTTAKAMKRFNEMLPV